MADFVFNVALGRAAELYHRVQSNDPANSALIVVAINTTATDATLKDLDTLSAVLANANTAEVTNTGYTRVTRTDADLVALAPDDANDRVDLDMADVAFGAITAGDAWTDLLICYDNDTTGGTDVNLIPIAQYDFAVTPDGSEVTAVLNAAGFFRAS